MSEKIANLDTGEAASCSPEASLHLTDHPANDDTESDKPDVDLKKPAETPVVCQPTKESELTDNDTQEDNLRIRRASPARRRKSEDVTIKTEDPISKESPEDYDKLPSKSENSTPAEEPTKSPPAEMPSEPEDSEVGIVGPATAAGDVLNDEELLDTCKDDKVDVQIAAWVERSSLQNADSKNSLQITTKDLNIVQPTRKSQRIVTSIIKRSIKW